MCISAIFVKSLDNSISIAFNREEITSRSFKDPNFFIYKNTKIIAGIDDLKGGTWLGINENKIFCLVTNRKSNKSKIQSRGKLVLEILAKKSISSCLSCLQEETKNGMYGGFNLIFGNLKHIFYTNNKENKPKILKEGRYFLSNGFINDQDSKRIKAISQKCLNLTSSNFVTVMKKNLELSSLENNYMPKSSSSIIKITKEKIFWTFSSINDDFKKWHKIETGKLFK